MVEWRHIYAKRTATGEQRQQQVITRLKNENARLRERVVFLEKENVLLKEQTGDVLVRLEELQRKVFGRKCGANLREEMMRRIHRVLLCELPRAIAELHPKKKKLLIPNIFPLKAVLFAILHWNIPGSWCATKKMFLRQKSGTSF